jgi:alkanesulfonate monooxygenase SsuD/methylene tetrahydromethanopterin reductase-like flavin-dependent oxidoreductase (luciferase family)
VQDTYQEAPRQDHPGGQTRLCRGLGRPEVHAATEPIALPLIFMAAAIRVTTQIKFATGAINLPRHHTATVAAERAEFDHMFKGRFILDNCLGLKR